MSEYKQVKIGKLRLKGVEEKRKKKKKRKVLSGEAAEVKVIDEDAILHNGWWAINSFDKLNGGATAIQLFNNSYIFANDNGTISPGKCHIDNNGNHGPKEEEIFTMIKISDNKVAFKSGYGKYISVNARGEILARSEAAGPQEQLEIVIEDGKVAIQGHNGYFLTLAEDSEIKCLSKTAKTNEMVCLRTNVSKSKKKKVQNEEEVGDVRKFEINYVKQFQSFGDHRLKLHEGPSSSLENARTKGKLHEAMLDRREKMKADRYCK